VFSLSFCSEPFHWCYPPFLPCFPPGPGWYVAPVRHRDDGFFPANFPYSGLRLERVGMVLSPSLEELPLLVMTGFPLELSRVFPHSVVPPHPSPFSLIRSEPLSAFQRVRVCFSESFSRTLFPESILNLPFTHFPGFTSARLQCTF